MNEYQPMKLPSNILVVDDKLENLLLLQRMLSEQGYKVRKVRDGQMALTAAQTAPPDLILLDINMPGMDGYEVCDRLKALATTRHIPIIFLSALDEVHDKVKAFEVGGIDYITKPFQFAEVLVRVKTHLEIAQLQQQLVQHNNLLHKEVRDRQKIEEALKISEAKEREKSRQLEQTLHQFQQTQMQLIQTEKMSSLGQMVAGIAHEINNPVSFIYGNLTPAKNYSQDLLNLLKLYQQALPLPTEEIEDFIEAIDLDFIQLDLPKLIDSMLMGTERIQKIVTSLRNFSRLDEATFKAVDIHEGLESTLLIIRHRLIGIANRQEILLAKEYGNLPKVECYPVQLNQVFLNIFTNAIDALEELQRGNKEEANCTPTITIRTALLNRNWVAIYISDNGPGIAPKTRQKIFDPFFTTKEVGKGTGLGMSVSYQIVVDMHGGQIRCFSQLGEGAMFVIAIPVQQKDSGTKDCCDYIDSTVPNSAACE